MKQNVFGWVEIPVNDMDRAVKFYNEVFGFELHRNQMGELEMAWFPSSEDPSSPGAAGSLVYHKEFYKPSQDGSLVYFSSPSGNAENELRKVEASGGSVLVPKKLISPDVGYMGVFIDSEGNRVAIHSTS
jgi:predicted enzyme related to lactoylglutathione lyase